MLGLVGLPNTRRAGTWRYCVIGGGEEIVVYPRHKGVSLIASTAPSYRPRGIGPGSPLTSLRQRFHDLRAVGGRILVATLGQGAIVFVSRAGTVQAVAIAP